jgi:hypothetical protein
MLGQLSCTAGHRNTWAPRPFWLRGQYNIWVATAPARNLGMMKLRAVAEAIRFCAPNGWARFLPGGHWQLNGRGSNCAIMSKNHEQGQHLTSTLATRWPWVQVCNTATKGKIRNDSEATERVCGMRAQPGEHHKAQASACIYQAGYIQLQTKTSAGSCTSQGMTIVSSTSKLKELVLSD